jgi:hypothetical protein
MQVVQVFQAHQWQKNGDHPDDYRDSRLAREFEGAIVRYFRRPDVSGEDVCAFCSKTFHEHGWIDPAQNKNFEYVVCPGDWILTSELGIHVAVHDELFRKGYMRVENCAVYSQTPL